MHQDKSLRPLNPYLHCTAEALPAILAACYAVYHGPAGLETIAARAHRMALILALGLERLGFELIIFLFLLAFAVTVLLALVR